MEIWSLENTNKNNSLFSDLKLNSQLKRKQDNTSGSSSVFMILIYKEAAVHTRNMSLFINGVHKLELCFLGSWKHKTA